MNIDPLAQVVALLHPTARFSKSVECAGSWKMERGGTGEPFYGAVLEGECRVAVDDEPFMTLKAGDFLLVPAMHKLKLESPDAPADEPMLPPVEITPGCFRLGLQTGPAALRMQVGHCCFNSPDAKLLVSLLPKLILARGESRLVSLIQLVNDETRTRRPAHDFILERLLEVLLVEALRCGGEGKSTPGLARGLNDARLAQALRAIHERPEHTWTIAELAAEAALSRSAFFARFNRVIGLPPMEYVLIWRMALAKQLLRERDLGIQQIAERVGYSSASTFTVAFTSYTGSPPARYARMQEQGKIAEAAALT